MRVEWSALVVGLRIELFCLRFSFFGNLTPNYKSISWSKISFSVATIATAAVDTYTVDDPHTISCVLTEVHSQVNVQWTTIKSSEAKVTLALQQGTHSGTTQTSTLTLSNAQKIALKATSTNPAHIFTCKITVGKNPTDYTATQTVNIYTPGKILLANPNFLFSHQFTGEIC